MDKNRKTAFLVLRDVETKNSYSNLSLNHHIAIEKPESPSFVRELVYGVLTWKLYLDHLIARQLARPKTRLKPADRVLLRMGVYQILYMSSVPDYAAVDGCVRLARIFCKGREGFINGVLRSCLERPQEPCLPDVREKPQEYLSVRYSYAPWIVELWMDQYGREGCEKLLTAGNVKPELTIRVNSLKTSVDQLKESLESQGFTVERGSAVEGALRVSGGQLLSGDLYKEGLFSVQDESSMLAVFALGPKPGDTVVDVCAAPGGKSLFAAELMEDTGIVYARDIYESRLKLLSDEAKRLGVHIVKTQRFDGEKTDESLFRQVDRVLVDAPCSGLGVLRRKPEVKYREPEQAAEALPEKQFRILTASAEYVKQDGVLVYSTCTVNRQENEEVVERFLSSSRCFTLEEQRQILPGEQGMDGFFISKMKRIR